MHRYAVARPQQVGEHGGDRPVYGDEKGRNHMPEPRHSDDEIRPRNGQPRHVCMGSRDGRNPEAASQDDRKYSKQQIIHDTDIKTSAAELASESHKARDGEQVEKCPNAMWGKAPHDRRRHMPQGARRQPALHLRLAGGGEQHRSHQRELPTEAVDERPAQGQVGLSHTSGLLRQRRKALHQKQGLHRSDGRAAAVTAIRCGHAKLVLEPD
mmetsp:Transcript_53270/g.171865  ORF Transcript_53270/g.171865 Transcript_53270/m.171865 type:complete len:211 (+) Transcript_53270:922-1554(+)